MTRRKSTPPEAALVAIDVAKHRNEVLIEAVRGGRRRRMTILNTRADHDKLITSLRGSADLKGFLSQHPERVASLTVLCPAVLDTRTLAPLGQRLLVVTGDRGPGARRVQAGLPELSLASAVVLDDYTGLTWSDIAAERGDSIAAAMKEFLPHHDARSNGGMPEREGEIAGISYRARGA